jgi:hypothetical protein
MKFKISSALKDQIGKELITDDNVAIFELVKNSYDAEAKNVKIVFKEIKGKSPKIFIIDNGLGMSKKDLEEKWLFVAYSEKQTIGGISKNKRFMAGSKGMGRFSCDRLGSKLKVYTKTRLDRDFNLLDIDWGDFEKGQEKEFKDIDVSLKTNKILKETFGIIKKSGTIIEISDLRNDWNFKNLQKLKGYLQRLINPLQIPNKDSFEIELISKDFVVDDNKQRYDYYKVNGIVENIVYEKLKVKTTTIESNISEDGTHILTKFSDKGIKIFELKENNKFDLKDIKVKVSFLNTQAKSTFTKLMGIGAVNYGNLFVFKNGFRIFPYGEEDNDWLQINKRKTQGHSRYLGTREILGRIEINDPKSEFFKEVTSRSEGLIDNKYLAQLKEFVFNFIIKRLEKYVVGAIDWDSDREKDPEKEKKGFDSIKKDTLKIIKQIAGDLENKDLKYNKDFLKMVEQKTIEKIPETIKNIENIIKKEKDKEIKVLYNKQVQSLKLGLKLQKEKQKEIIEEKDKEIEIKEKESLFLSKAISTDKEIMLSLAHIIDNSTSPIRNALKKINKKINEDASIKEIIPYIDEIDLENKKIKSLSEMASLANFNTKVTSIKKDLIKYIVDYLGKMKSTEIDFKFNGQDLEFIKRFKPLEISIMLDNFISNSLKAKASLMLFNFKLNKKEIVINISDDSKKGIDSKNKNFIFNRGFTTTKGSGIGLYNIRKMVESMDGKFKYIGNAVKEQLKGACFEIRIQK